MAGKGRRLLVSDIGSLGMRDQPDQSGGCILVPTGNNIGLLRQKPIMMELQGKTEFVLVEAAIIGFWYRFSCDSETPLHDINKSSTTS